MLAQVAPAAPAAAEGLAALFLFLAFLVCIGLQKAWRHTVGWLFVRLATLLASVRLPGVLGGARLFGPVVDFLNSTNRQVEHALGVAALKSEAGAVWLFATAAHQLSWLSHELRHLAHATLHAIEHAGGATIHDVTRVTKGVTAASVRTMLHPLTVALHALERAEHALSLRVAHIERALPETLPRWLPGVLPRVGSLEREFDALRRRVDGIARDLAPAALVALIGATIFKLLPDFIRCPSFASFGRKLGCGGFQLLSDLLEPAFVAFALTDLCDFTAAIEGLARELSPALAELVVVEDALVGCHGAGAAPNLPLPALSLPPATLGLQLAG